MIQDSSMTGDSRSVIVVQEEGDEKNVSRVVGFPEATHGDLTQQPTR